MLQDSICITANGRVFTNTGLKIPKFSTETEREKKADTRFDDFNPVFANTMLCAGRVLKIKNNIMTIDEKVEKINELLELKEVTVQDDYFTDIFNDKNNKEIFRVMSPRGFEKHPEKVDEVIDFILQELTSFENVN